MTTELKPEIADLIQIASDSVHRLLEAELDDWNPHRYPVCISASIGMRTNLETLGIAASIRYSARMPELSPPIHATCFIPDKDGYGDGTIIDPTWQQFLPQPTDRLPKVLVCKVSELAATLTTLGIPAEKHLYWLSAA